MLKPVITIIMLLSFALQTFSTALIMADYVTNTASYAKNCENKAKPSMHCNGKCQMMKKMQREEQKDQQNPERKGDSKNETVLYLPTAFSCLSTVTTMQNSTFYMQTGNSKLLKMPRSVFHPPSA